VTLTRWGLVGRHDIARWGRESPFSATTVLQARVRVRVRVRIEARDRLGLRLRARVNPSLDLGP